jgi:hypothetical protein
MSTAVRDVRNSQSADRWQQRVDAGDWDAITTEIDEYGGALLPQLLTAGETARIRSLYTDDGLFRSTINMGRHRFGEGEYRYFKAPYPEPVERLKQALYPRLLPIARDWWARLGRPAPWPDTLDEWLRMCHDAGQAKSTAILLRYGQGDWNALHRDLYGDLVFPLQVVVNLNEPGVDHTGGEFLLLEQRPRAQSRGTRMVSRPGPPRSVRDQVRSAAHACPGLPRRGLISCPSRTAQVPPCAVAPVRPDRLSAPTSPIAPSVPSAAKAMVRPGSQGVDHSSRRVIWAHPPGGPAMTHRSGSVAANREA